jgi:hypothetical protein
MYYSLFAVSTECMYTGWWLDQWSRLALSKGPNRVGVSPHPRTETDPVSETSCFSSNYLESGRWTKSENPVILWEHDLRSSQLWLWRVLGYNSVYPVESQPSTRRYIPDDRTHLTKVVCRDVIGLNWPVGHELLSWRRCMWRTFRAAKQRISWTEELSGNGLVDLSGILYTVFINWTHKGEIVSICASGPSVHVFELEDCWNDSDGIFIYALTKTAGPRMDLYEDRQTST